MSLKIARNIGVLNKIKYILSRDILLILFYTMIHPYLLYCNVVWGGASQTALYKLICLQKRAVRLVTSSEYRTPSSPLFKQLRILKLHDIHKLQIYLFMFKFKYGMLPLSCAQLVRRNTIVTRYGLRRENEFVVMPFHTEIRRKCMSVKGPDLWNSLEDSMKTLSLIYVFKSRLVSSSIEYYSITIIIS